MTRDVTPGEAQALAPEIEEGRSHAIAAQYHERKAKESHGRLTRLNYALYGKGAVLDTNTMKVTLPEEATDGV